MKILRNYLARLCALICALGFALVLAGCVTKKNNKTTKTRTNSTTEEQYEYSIREISYNPDDYIGDLETFTYGLLINQLDVIYSTFPAYVELSDTQVVYGIAYTNYKDCYLNEDETISYVMCGFIPYCGELEIADDEFNSGLYLYNLDYQDEETIFVWGYKSDPFSLHCVVYGRYLVYGVNEQGIIFFTSEEYKKENCDTSLGALYSYDQKRYLYDPDFGNYQPITGESLSDEMDFEEIERQINEQLELQNVNYTDTDIESSVTISQDAIKSYLLSMQEETFLGYNVELLIQLTEELEPQDVLRINSDGLQVLEIEEIPPTPPSLLTKWLVGISCGIVVAVSTVVSQVMPQFRLVAGALAGAAIEMFMQVVVNNTNLGNLDWKKIGVAAVTGAICGVIGPHIQAIGGITSQITDTFVDGIMGGIEQAVLAALDGGNFDTCMKQFGYGVAMGIAFSCAIKIIGKAASLAIKGLKTGIAVIAKKIEGIAFKKVCKFVAEIPGKIKNKIASGLNTLKKVVGDKIDKIRQNHLLKKAKREFLKQAEDYVDDFSDDLIRKSFDSLSTKELHDMAGNIISKEDLKKVFKKTKSGKIGYYEIDGKKIFAIKQNGIVSVDFGDDYSRIILKSKDFSKYVSKNGIRNYNMKLAADELRKKWAKNASSCPEEIKNILRQKYPNESVESIVNAMSSTDLLDIIKSSSYVLHENADLVSVSLVPRELHDKANGYTGVGHMGGAALEASVKANIGKKNLGKYINGAASGIAVA